jgi:hypothetical protein
MDKKHYTHIESNNMSTTSINQFIEAARQHLFGLFPLDNQPKNASKPG